MKRRIYLIVSFVTLIIFLATACGAPAPTAAPAPQLTQAPPPPQIVVTPAPMRTATPPPVTAPRPTTTQPPAAGPTTPEWQQKWDKAVEGAKKEGQLNLYTSIGTSARQVIAKEMKEKYGVNAEFVTGRGAEVAEKVVTEQRAGIYEADAFIIGSVNIITNLKPVNAAQPMAPFLLLPEVTNPENWLGGQMQWAESDHIGFGIVASWDTYITVNTDFIKEDEITSYKDLTKPEYKGKIAMFDPLRGGTGQAAVAHIVYVLGDTEGKKVLKGLAQQDLTFTNDYRQLVEWV
ncbi:MAG: extracellular solute-binding protein, partial [Dehalococcoidia bacterium]|nr:extracellular solute-binding protein [Dehalococcoidia bacterium]